jgi:ribosome-associated protein
MMIREVKISTETITLGQLLKLTNVIETGGMAKRFLQTHEVLVNGELEQRRGRKLKPEDVVEIRDIGTFIVRS